MARTTKLRQKYERAIEDFVAKIKFLWKEANISADYSAKTASSFPTYYALSITRWSPKLLISDLSFRVSVAVE